MRGRDRNENDLGYNILPTYPIRIMPYFANGVGIIGGKKAINWFICCFFGLFLLNRYMETKRR